ncbi:MAG: MFS transporter [Myxococcales bacterium]|nr:MFS transporter [Myxococcales bacterium]
MLISAYAVQLVGVGTILASVPFFARYQLAGDDDTVTILFVALVLPAFLFMPVWVLISKRTGKLAAYLVATVMLGLGAASLWFSSPDAVGLVYAQVAIMGVGWAGTQLFPFSMLPDTITVDREATGQRREGVFTGLWMAVDKGGMAVGALLAGLFLDLGGFVESEGGTPVTQPDSALTAILCCSAVVPAVFLLASLPILRRYGLAAPRASDKGMLQA